MARTVNRDLTQGSPMKLIISFALPLLGGFLFQQLYSFIDTAIVGRFLGYDALAAVGSTGSLNFLINGFCMGLCSGFAIPIAQAKRHRFHSPTLHFRNATGCCREQSGMTSESNRNGRWP